MAHKFGVNYERHPMVAPIWDRLQGIEQQLDRLDLAVNTILKHLNISLPSELGPVNGEPNHVSSTSQSEVAPGSQVSDAPYVYKALSFEKAEIRLLALYNADDDSEEIKGTLELLSLEAPQTARLKQYNAMSYCWGEPKMDGRVIVDGHVFPVTRNLESALRQMRKRATKEAATARAPSPMTLWWIDQICINQEDIEERGNQVSLMRRIYKGAQSVHVWLGDAIEGSALAMDVVGKIGRPPARGPGEKEVEYPELSEEEVRKNWHALRLLLDQPWWLRSWIRQEASLGSRTQVSWGDYNIGFDVLSQAVMAIEYADSLGHQLPALCLGAENQQPGDGTLDFSFYHQARSLRTLRKASHSGRSFVPLHELLLHSRHCKATDLRDKVYSMLGMADPEVYLLRPDYRLSLPEVLKSAARAILPQKKGLRLLGACQNYERRHDLPSWVPNLIDDWKYRPFEADDVRHHISIAEPSVQFEHDTLLIKGFIFDTVTTICDTVVPPNATTEQIDDVYRSWQEFVEKAHEAGHTDVGGHQYGATYGLHEKKDMFWVNFLSTDRMASRHLRYSQDDNTTLLPEREDGLKMQYLGLNLKLAQSYLLPASSEPSSLHPLRPIRAALKKYGVGRRVGICVGQKTPVLLPGDAMPGDAIAVFRGASFPYVLRKLSVEGQGTAEEQYVLVGEAFLPETASNKAIAFAPKTADAIRIV
ncbi:uncharacterized protein Z520_08608 [Fonsecaea multimorphosa CBS 102226]|uniref:Heterokaryon incompatibility domain-containing protein n=1 Tax=Fonsecaea multimorphosa CBS 102226 TaxID=1442371 RepID=A0A0D2KFM7_9EURO|nr:uncharacterized protein Z520_08608 [Fonsecaea multimorphosa CBS 102226]KIX95488.1 hypothetical protein Z520_08608 [Fonsecaea multimorphosa CBS 102226]OAL21334.1 hypothetical protein AYO22_08057 [Fonsecaea multimorphosa]